MRKTLLFLSVIGLLMTSCEKDNDDDNDQNSEDSSSDINESGAYPDGTVHCNGTPTAIVDVTNPTTGKTWMDRNLGASQAATSSTDSLAYGDLYQWGRFSDGHQCRSSGTTNLHSNSAQPIHGDFIAVGRNSSWEPMSIDFYEYDSLWQGVDGINNPCPSGYRLPTEAELEAEILSWISDNAAGAFASPLKLPVAGYRSGSDGSLSLSYAHYWTSTFDDTWTGQNLLFNGTFAFMQVSWRADGHSVRCIKD
jgi:hypothetical protein